MTAATVTTSMSAPVLRAGLIDDLAPEETRAGLEIAPEAPMTRATNYRSTRSEQPARPTGPRPYWQTAAIRRFRRAEMPSPSAFQAAAERRKRRAAKAGASNYARGNAA